MPEAASWGNRDVIEAQVDSQIGLVKAEELLVEPRALGGIERRKARRPMAAPFPIQADRMGVARRRLTGGATCRPQGRRFRLTLAHDIPDDGGKRQRDQDRDPS